MAHQYVQLEPRSTVWNMYRVMVGLGLLCAVIIVGVFQYTSPMIQQNKRELLEQSILSLIPAAKHIVQYQYDETTLFKPLAKITDSGEIYACFSAHHELLGLVIKAQGMGYQDRIVLIYNYSPDEQVIHGIKVLESRETPGLGTRIETDQQFLKNFTALDVALSDSRSELQHPIEVVKPGNKQHPWQIDTITGATISSRAVGQIMQLSTAHWIPKLQRESGTFQHGSK